MRTQCTYINAKAHSVHVDSLPLTRQTLPNRIKRGARQQKGKPMLNYLIIGQAAMGQQHPDLKAHAEMSCSIGRLQKFLTGLLGRR